MAELDYAYLAEYATVQNGTLTAVGASFCEMRAPLPFRRSVTLAGRVRAPRDTAEFEISVDFDPPGDTPVFSTSGLVTPEIVDQRYADKVGLLFAVRQELRFTEPGLCEVRVSLDGELVRTLKFEVIDAPEP
ncbi:hypothetical protein A5633_14395 [Mycolicibacterium elephantis]|uniref:DUF6941 family protein n=1 Tax=Mycolicibacterium elephantis TaxID=81858 RepID=UPI0007E99D6C|nr:hypothetical protein [Mycolicibacterium elephantis]OBA83504.1 hypothetical protein A5633_14395 [Mycolicibacterium elephantis]